MEASTTENKLSKTYRETCEEFLAELKAKSEHPETIADPTFAFLFAEYLDSFPTMTTHLQLLAMQKVQQIDREFISELIDELGTEKASVIARRVNERHLRKYGDKKPETTEPQPETNEVVAGGENETSESIS